MPIPINVDLDDNIEPQEFWQRIAHVIEVIRNAWRGRRIADNSNDLHLIHGPVGLTDDILLTINLPGNRALEITFRSADIYITHISPVGVRVGEIDRVTYPDYIPYEINRNNFIDTLMQFHNNPNRALNNSSNLRRLCMVFAEAARFTTIYNRLQAAFQEYNGNFIVDDEINRLTTNWATLSRGIPVLLRAAADLIKNLKRPPEDPEDPGAAPVLLALTDSNLHEVMRQIESELEYVKEKLDKQNHIKTLLEQPSHSLVELIKIFNYFGISIKDDIDIEILEDIISLCSQRAIVGAGLLKVVGKTTGKVVAKEIMEKISPKLITEMATKLALKEGPKIAAEKVPIVGAIIGGIFGIVRLAKGDVLGAGLEVTSGLSSTVPGYGTAVSLGIDAGIIARDVKIEIDAYKKMIDDVCDRFSSRLPYLNDSLDSHQLYYQQLQEILRALKDIEQLMIEQEETKTTHDHSGDFILSRHSFFHAPTSSEQADDKSKKSDEMASSTKLMV